MDGVSEMGKIHLVKEGIVEIMEELFDDDKPQTNKENRDESWIDIMEEDENEDETEDERIEYDQLTGKRIPSTQEGKWNPTKGRRAWKKSH